MTDMVRREPPWIPPTGLAIGQLSHGLSWAALLALSIGAEGRLVFGSSGLAWIHLVALGWLTTVALSVLLFVIPNLCEEPIRHQLIARAAVVAFAVGAYVMAVGFWYGAFDLVLVGAWAIVAALACYLVPVGSTLLRAMTHQARGERAVARAMTIVLLALASAGVLGVLMAWGLVHAALIAFLGVAPAIHAHLAGIGWLTLLVFGTSLQTLRPITGGPSPSRLRHVVSGVGSITGLALLIIGLALGVATLVHVGALVIAVAVLLFVVDLARAIARATVPHRVPQAFLAAAGVWLLVSVALGLGVLAGRPWGEAYAYAALIGWLGQMVNGHLHHIGIRLLATMVRGENDETRPGTVLMAPVSWFTWISFQAAVACGLLALLQGNARVLTAGAVLGLLGWCAMAGNIGIALQRLTTPRPMLRDGLRLG